ncbi:MurR/RpiR family transcriptional regulator [Pseudarthrobacter sp. NIBRBAC000502770]|uniref:MurR/RpiR family transcriptional regulator n=1 Tax=Pseudarthrobacter sp. NIBRBAC000502770 TaxID=2590785 RepID=UPI00113FCA8F|nr:MurR/RpiR family transcriptional regulator [Pseudarthrobacter sp. NIBRBAC000502770]QDG89050.1 MurR/RpiR family transcriptional regulator [Pseudarthrobacter sp. NIBRBAC000502770]
MIRVKNEIFARMEEMAPSERKVARTLLADYPSIGLASANTLAKAAGTSAPTVLRLVARLGMDSYADFQKHLRDEIMHELSAPVHRAERVVDGDEEMTGFGRIVAERRELVDRLHSTVATGEFDRAAKLLAADARAVLIAGGYYSRFVAEILARQLDQIIPNVDFLADPLGYDIGKLYTARKNTVVILFDLRRYQQPARQVAALAKKEGASLIVITDEGLSPSADDADVVLAVPVGGIPFDSFAPLMVLIEALVESVLVQTGSKGINRMKLWEERSLIQRAAAARPRLEEES